MLDWTVVYCNRFVLLSQCVFFPMLTLSIAVLFAAPWFAGMAHQFNHLSLLFIKEKQDALILGEKLFSFHPFNMKCEFGY